MTVFQTSVGNKADHGAVGFEPGSGRQFLIFPKSLRKFTGNAVVGIKYDLWKTRELRKSERVRAPQPPRRPEKRKETALKTQPSPALDKVIPFKAATVEEDEEEEDEAIADLKRKVRRVMEVLREGKQVAAYNLLERIVGA